ncbi:MAG: HD domain-containing protein [Dysosmobacter sp.]|nr:HD domain-containing protein [Dysosmobacter sp.]MDY3866267.1 HD domain-containing protein [Dysosmobacter sp.]
MIELSKRNKKILEDLKRFQPDTYAHSIRVKRYVLELLFYLNSIGRTAYTQREIDLICEGAMLHDVGKMKTENHILTKEGALDPEERAHMALHGREGSLMVQPGLRTEDETEIVMAICARHHDKIKSCAPEDSSDPPLYVQIVSICDAYDALCSKRYYHMERTPMQALEMIRDGKCGLFSAQLVQDLAEAQKRSGRL